jgi:hypothetical protein
MMRRGWGRRRWLIAELDAELNSRWRGNGRTDSERQHRPKGQRSDQEFGVHLNLSTVTTMRGLHCRTTA